MPLALPNTALAYINFGRWVADCPAGCGSAWELDPAQMLAQCGECMNVCPVQWPPNSQELWDVLLHRPLPRTRNWFPADHPLAVQAHCPHGQSVEDLRQETMEHALEEISPFWSESPDPDNPKQRDCQDCVDGKPHTQHWQGVKQQDRGML